MRIPLLGAGVLGHSLGSLGHGVLGQFTREQQTNSSLDFPGGDGGPAVVVGKTGGLGSNALEDVVHEGVHDGHGLAGDTSVRVHLFQHLVDVDGVALPPPPLPLLLSGTGGLGLGGGLLGSLTGCCFLWWHVYYVLNTERMILTHRIFSFYMKTASRLTSLAASRLTLLCVLRCCLEMSNGSQLAYGRI